MYENNIMLLHLLLFLSVQGQHPLSRMFILLIHYSTFKAWKYLSPHSTVGTSEIKMYSFYPITTASRMCFKSNLKTTGLSNIHCYLMNRNKPLKVNKKPANQANKKKWVCAGFLFTALKSFKRHFADISRSRSTSWNSLVPVRGIINQAVQEL